MASRLLLTIWLSSRQLGQLVRLTLWMLRQCSAGTLALWLVGLLYLLAALLLIPALLVLLMLWLPLRLCLALADSLRRALKQPFSRLVL